MYFVSGGVTPTSNRKSLGLKAKSSHKSAAIAGHHVSIRVASGTAGPLLRQACFAAE